MPIPGEIWSYPAGVARYWKIISSNADELGNGGNVFRKAENPSTPKSGGSVWSIGELGKVGAAGGN